MGHRFMAWLKTAEGGSDDRCNSSNGERQHVLRETTSLALGAPCGSRRSRQRRGRSGFAPASVIHFVQPTHSFGSFFFFKDCPMKRSGFTLVELLVVIAIIGIL